MSRKPIPEPSAKQKRFADNYIQNGLYDAYQAAIKAGYSKNYANCHVNKLTGNVVIKHYILQRTGANQKRNWRDKVRDRLVIDNMYKSAAGSNKKSHYILHDLKHPENSSDQIMVGPTASREQINAVDLFLRYKGLEYSNSKELEQAKSAKERAEAKSDQIKSKYSEKIYKLKFQLASAKIRKTKAEAKIKELLAKQNDSSNNQTISKVDELLDQIFKDGKN